MTKRRRGNKPPKEQREPNDFRTIKDALWARYGTDFGRLLDDLYKRTTK